MTRSCELWEFALNCELSNSMTMVLELTIAGMFAIILGAIIYRKQSKDSKKLFELEHRPNLELILREVMDNEKEENTHLQSFHLFLYVKNHGLSNAIMKNIECKMETILNIDDDPNNDDFEYQFYTSKLYVSEPDEKFYLDEKAPYGFYVHYDVDERLKWNYSTRLVLKCTYVSENSDKQYVSEVTSTPEFSEKNLSYLISDKK